jgi:hypothetical protein
MEKDFVRKGMSPVAEIDRVYGTIGSRLRHDRVHGVTSFNPSVPCVAASTPTITVNVGYDIGRRQTIESRTPASNMSTSIAIPQGVNPAQGHSSYSKTAVVRLGEIRQISLLNDVRLNICVALPKSALKSVSTDLLSIS